MCPCSTQGTMFTTASPMRRTDSPSRLSRNGRLFWRPTPMPPGTAHPSGKPDVNCEVPAAALYAAFAAEGWDVTYTVIRRYEKVRIPGTKRYWYNEYAWHCLVDVHTKEGFKWFNGNKPGHNADGKPIGESTEPDKDGDGNPKTEDKPGSTPTEFSKDGETAVRTEVYKSPADAQKADALRFR
jgi:hypothetical protein